MHAKSAVAVALLSAAPLVSAGSTIVKNSCNFPVYITSVTNEAGGQQKIHHGQSWSQAYQTNPDGGGVSVKISNSPSIYTAGASITQLEYTVTDTLWYDMSNINGNPFMQWGMSLKPSSSSCRNVLCAAGVEECAAAYNTPDQNEATAACTPDSNLELELCSANGNNVANTATQAIGGALDVAEEHKHKHHNKHHNKHHDNSDDKKHHNKHHNNSDDKKHHNKHHHKGHHKEPAPVPVPTSVSVPASIPVPSSISVPASIPVPAAAMTTFLTQVVTVTARDAKPSADAHAHANYHRHHFHRHS